MNKYEKFNSYSEIDDGVLDNDEVLLYDLRPRKFAFIVNRVLYMLPIALVWLLFDIIFMVSIFKHDPSNIGFLFVPFIFIHLIPVWVWFYNVLGSNKRWVNTRYYVTDKRVIIKNGFYGKSYRTVFYKDIVNVHLNVGFFDKLMHVGDINIDVLGSISDGNGDTSLLDIESCNEVYEKIQSIVSGESGSSDGMSNDELVDNVSEE